jgi:UDP-N-acetylglucosamine acyltransferase
MSELIHATAIIAPGAKIGAGTSIGPYSVIGPHVVMGRANRIASHVVIEGLTTLGDENQIFQFASIGAVPQDLKYKGEPSVLKIGNKNIIREYVTLQPGTEGGGMETVIGNSNLFMACSHVGHDGRLGDGNIFANGAGLAGHVTVGSYVTVGGMAGVHQFVNLGDGCFLAGGAMVGKDVPPFCVAQGDHAELVGLNQVGLERRGASAADIQRLRKLYRDVFYAGPGEKLRFTERLAQAKENVSDFPLGRQFLDFFAQSKRGVIMARAKGADNGNA